MGPTRRFQARAFLIVLAVTLIGWAVALNSIPPHRLRGIGVWVAVCGYLVFLVVISELFRRRIGRAEKSAPGPEAKVATRPRGGQLLFLVLFELTIVGIAVAVLGTPRDRGIVTLFTLGYFTLVLLVRELTPWGVLRRKADAEPQAK